MEVTKLEILFDDIYFSFYNYFSAWILIVTQILKFINVFRYNFLEYILMYLAWLKGYKGPYYRGYIGNIFGGFMFSGVFSSIAIIFLQQWLKLKDISKNLARASFLLDMDGRL